MKLTILIKELPPKIFGQYDPVPLFLTGNRHVYIDGKLVPPGLARLILLGLDVANEQYTDSILKEMKQEGHEI